MLYGTSGSSGVHRLRWVRKSQSVPPTRPYVPPPREHGGETPRRVMARVDIDTERQTRENNDRADTLSFTYRAPTTARPAEGGRRRRRRRQLAGTFESSAGSSPYASRPATPAAVRTRGPRRKPKTTVPLNPTHPVTDAYRRTVVGAIRRRAVVVVVVTPHFHAHHAGRLRLRHVIVVLLPVFLGHGGRHGGRRQQRRQQTHRRRHVVGGGRPAAIVVRAGCGWRRRSPGGWRRHWSPLPLFRWTRRSRAPC